MNEHTINEIFTRFFWVKLKGVGNLASVKHLKNSMSGKDLVDPLDPRGLT